MSQETYEIDQPWVIYRYLTTDRRTRFTGRSRIQAECAICGNRTVLTIRIPRFGKVPDVGRHPKRIAYLREHVHEERPSPILWARPLLNPDALGPTISVEQVIRSRLDP